VKSNLIERLQAGATNATAAKEFNTSEAAIRRFRKRWQIGAPAPQRAYTKIDGDKAEAQTELSTTPILDDPDAMLRQRGLDPSEWEVTNATLNEWQGPGSEGATTYYQTKFSVRRLTPSQWVQPARPRGPRVEEFEMLPSISALTRGNTELAVIVGDQQAPFHDEDLHQQFLSWLACNQPDIGVLIGDTVDFPDISRHAFDPDSTATVNECVQSGYDLLFDYVAASPVTRWVKLVGNHDERIRQYVLSQARELYGLRRATRRDESVESSVLSLDHLLRLDELGIELIDPHGPYEQAQYNLSDKLAVRHGHLVKRKAGETALANLEELGYSVFVGHVHRQAIVEKTRHDIGGFPSVIMGVEIGCMCVTQRTERNGRFWPNYTVNPNWQAGFATADIWPDGKFSVDLAKFVNGTLLWRNQRYA